MVTYKRPPNKPYVRKSLRKKKSDIIIQNWHLENHKEGSRQWKLTMALAEENDFNDLWIESYSSCDGYLISRQIGD